MTSDITVEKSQRSPDQKPWWWLYGDTYPHRELLKQHGARFSGGRRQWYVIAWELPVAIRDLVTHETVSAEGTKGETVSPLLAIFGGRITGKERAANGDVIVRGDNGIFATRTTWIDRNDQPEVVWEFDLPPQARAGHPLPAIQQALQATHAVYSVYTRKWHLDQPDQVAALDALAAVVPDNPEPPPSLPPMSPALSALIEEALAADDAKTQSRAPEAPPNDTPPPAIRITKPAPFPAEGESLDAIQMAIRATKPNPPISPRSAIPARATGRVVPITQSYCGELTGSITGQVFCYGWAIHEGVCVYLNLGGPRMSVEAIRAKLGKGDIVTVVPDDAPAIELTAGEGNSGMYHDYLHTIPEARFTSLILLHEWVVNPNYGGAATTFILKTSDEQAQAKLKHHIAQLVNVPVFDQWTPFLWTAGHAAMLVRPTRSAGGIDLLTISLDATAWTRLITGGLEQGLILLPG